MVWYYVFMDIENTIREYLPEVIHMSLATTKENKPWVCEVHFAYDDKLNLYFRSLTSRRHSNEIAENPNVAGNIVKQFEINEAGVGVYFEGTASLLTDPAEKEIAFQSIRGRFGLGDEILAESDNPEGHQFYKITVHAFYVFGVFDKGSSQKYELEWNKPTPAPAN